TSAQIVLVAIENQTKRRGSRGFTRYLVAGLIGVAATLAWQSYGDAGKQVIATKAPELAWSPEARKMITSWEQTVKSALSLIAKEQSKHRAKFCCPRLSTT